MGHSLHISVIDDQMGFHSLLSDFEPLVHSGIIQLDLLQPSVGTESRAVSSVLIRGG